MIYKRGDVYWYKFMWQAKLVRESTKQGNDKVARQMEAAHRTSLAKGEVGIREKKPAPTLNDFLTRRFEPWAKARFESNVPKTWLWYRTTMRAVLKYKPLASARLDEITSERIAEFAAHRQSLKMQVSSVNNSLRALRRMLRLAVEWGELEVAPQVKMLPGERHRERVVSPEEEARYLAAAPEPLASIAAVLADTGMRPEECFRLGWDAITWVNGRHGTLFVTHGKTAAARRVLPMTPRVRAILEGRWERAGKPVDGWIWPAATHSGHVEVSSLRKQHAKTFALIAEQAAKNNQKAVRPFVIYSLRHTFLTRLGESGCDVWTLARIAGHSQIGISSRYVHPSEDAMFAAISRLGGHKIGHSDESVIPANSDQRQLTQ
ncbi:MAG TPA: site-specific integrase [Candidatus Acidoferrales bacterium]|nr:site-specific integrase [Candidatus Acidoferrales bacterium]